MSEMNGILIKNTTLDKNLKTWITSWSWISHKAFQTLFAPKIWQSYFKQSAERSLLAKKKNKTTMKIKQNIGENLEN